MSNVVIKKAESYDLWLEIKGKYRRITDTDRGKGTAHVSCPKCGQTASLCDHTIFPNGTVKPSLVCPWTGCNFHAYVVLEDWDG